MSGIPSGSRSLGCQVAKERGVVSAEQVQQGVLQVGDSLPADEGLPLGPQIVEHGLAVTHQLGAAFGHLKLGPAPIARVEAAENVTVLFQEGNRLRRCLLGDRGTPTDLGDRSGSRRDGSQRKIVGRSDTGMTASGEALRRLFGHEPEPAEKQQSEIGTTARHGTDGSEPNWVDNLLVYLGR